MLWTWTPCALALCHVPRASLDVMEHQSHLPSLPRPFLCALARSRCRAFAPELAPPWPPPPSSRATAASSPTALLRLHRVSLHIRRITMPLLRPFFGHRGRRSVVAASSGGLEPLASVAGRLWALFVGAVPLCGLTQAPFGRGTAARRRGGAPPARVAVPGHPLLWFPTRDVAQKFK